MSTSDQPSVAADQGYHELRALIVTAEGDPGIYEILSNTQLHLLSETVNDLGFNSEKIWGEICACSPIESYFIQLKSEVKDRLLHSTLCEVYDIDPELAHLFFDPIQAQEAFQSDSDLLNTAGGTSIGKKMVNTWKPNSNRSTKERAEAIGIDAAEFTVGALLVYGVVKALKHRPNADIQDRANADIQDRANADIQDRTNADIEAPINERLFDQPKDGALISRHVNTMRERWYNGDHKFEKPIEKRLKEPDTKLDTDTGIQITKGRLEAIYSKPSDKPQFKPKPNAKNELDIPESESKILESDLLSGFREHYFTEKYIKFDGPDKGMLTKIAERDMLAKYGLEDFDEALQVSQATQELSYLINFRKQNPDSNRYNPDNYNRDGHQNMVKHAEDMIQNPKSYGKRGEELAKLVKSDTSPLAGENLAMKPEFKTYYEQHQVARDALNYGNDLHSRNKTLKDILEANETRLTPDGELKLQQLREPQPVETNRLESISKKVINETGLDKIPEVPDNKPEIPNGAQDLSSEVHHAEVDLRRSGDGEKMENELEDLKPSAGPEPKPDPEPDHTFEFPKDEISRRGATVRRPVYQPNDLSEDAKRIAGDKVVTVKSSISDELTAAEGKAEHAAEDAARKAGNTERDMTESVENLEDL